MERTGDKVVVDHERVNSVWVYVTGRTLGVTYARDELVASTVTHSSPARQVLSPHSGK